MAKRRLTEKVFDSVVHSTTLTSPPASWAKLGEMDTVRFEIRTSQAPSPNDALSVWIEDSNDGVNWNTIVQPMNGQTLSQNTNQQFWANVGGPNDPFRRYLRVRVFMSGTANVQVFAHARADQTITLDGELLYDDVLHGAGPFYTSPDTWQRLGAADACAWQASVSMGSTNSTLTVALETSIDGIFWTESTSKQVPYTASTNVYGFGSGIPDGAYARFRLSQAVNDTCRVGLRVTARAMVDGMSRWAMSSSCAGCESKGRFESRAIAPLRTPAFAPPRLPLPVRRTTPPMDGDSLPQPGSAPQSGAPLIYNPPYNEERENCWGAGMTWRWRCYTLSVSEVNCLNAIADVVTDEISLLKPLVRDQFLPIDGTPGAPGLRQYDDRDAAWLARALYLLEHWTGSPSCAAVQSRLNQYTATQIFENIANPVWIHSGTRPPGTVYRPVWQYGGRLTGLGLARLCRESCGWAEFADPPEVRGIRIA